MLDQDEGHAAVGRQRVEKLLEGLEAAGRSADADHREVAELTRSLAPRRLGWQKVNGRVVYSQPDGIRAWTANCMLLNAPCEASSIREIDLCGLPW
jgi:hypothetical protein